MNKPGISSIAWVFNALPSEEWKNRFGSALFEYFEGRADWPQVVLTAQTEWMRERSLSNTQ